MNCIRCQTRMKKVAKDKVLVDQCPECGGIWLDAGELEMLQRGVGHDQSVIMTQARKELLEDAQKLVTLVGFCPKCEVTKLRPVKKRGVEIDVCDHCEGIFFDDRELDQLIAGQPTATFFSAVLILIGR